MFERISLSQAENTVSGRPQYKGWIERMVLRRCWRKALDANISYEAPLMLQRPPPSRSILPTRLATESGDPRGCSVRVLCPASFDVAKLPFFWRSLPE